MFLTQDNNCKKRNEAGVAVMLALVTITVLAVLAAELIYETQVYRRIVFNSASRLQSYYLAKSGLKLARLQLLAAKKAKKQLKKLAGIVPISLAEVEMIWKLPLTLPPPVFTDASLALQSSLEELKEELGLGNATINISISGESQKISLNRLVWKPQIPRQTPPAGQVDTAASPENSMKNTIVNILTELINQKKDEDENFYNQYEYLNPITLIENLQAWIDPKINIDGDNLPKENYYQEQDPPYNVKNAPLYAFSELRLVKGFEEQLINFLEEYFTATLSEGLNINTAEKKLLKSIFLDLEEEEIDKIIERREILPFPGTKEFWEYMKEEFKYTEQSKKELEKKGIVITVDETSYQAIIEIDTNYSKRTWVAYFGLEAPSGSSSRSSNNQLTDDKTPPSIVYLRAD